MANRNWMAALALTAMLTACFEGETQLIPVGEAVLPIDGPITICLEEADPCIEMSVSGDGYVTDELPDSAEGATVRFAPLTQAADRQIYIIEGMPEEGDGVVFAIARRALSKHARGASFDVAAVECSALSEEAEQAFEAAGGQYRVGFLKTCIPPNLGALKVAFMTEFQPQFEDEAWWQENSME